MHIRPCWNISWNWRELAILRNCILWKLPGSILPDCKHLTSVCLMTNLQTSQAQSVAVYIYICTSILLKTLRTLQTKSMCFIHENFLHNLTSFHRSAHRICTRDCKKKAVGVACLIWAWTEILHIAIPPLHLGLHVHDFHLLFLIKILFHYFFLLLLLSLDPLNPQYSIQIP